MDEKNHTSESGILYVVATPIGNKDDITLRALNILTHVDMIAAEDTRRTHRFLLLHGIRNHLVSYHEHNEEKRSLDLLGRMKKGQAIALVSDAGTPLISDPGYRLIQRAVEQGFKVVPVPGAAAFTAALSVAGLPTDSFIFVGFPAKKKIQRKRQLENHLHENRTIIFYESPKRILGLLKEILEIVGDRYIVLGREITKLHEEFLRGFVSEIIDKLSKRDSIKGEITLLVKGEIEDPADVAEKALIEVEKGLKGDNESLSLMVKRIARKYSLSKNRVYSEALKMKSRMKD